MSVTRLLLVVMTMASGQCISCTRRSRNPTVPDNIGVKKIPRELLEKSDCAEDVK